MPDGHPCPLWLYRIIGTYPPVPSDDLTIHYPVHRTGFFHFYGRPNRRSWAIFLAAHATMGAALAFSHEPMKSESLAVIGLTGLDTITFLKLSPSLSVVGPVFATQHYIRDRVQ
jgi:hypothetical protein